MLQTAKALWQSLHPELFAPLAEVAPLLVRTGIVYFKGNRAEEPAAPPAAARSEDEDALDDDAALQAKATARSNRYKADLQTAEAAFQTSLAALVAAQSQLQAAVEQKADLPPLLRAMDAAAAAVATAGTGWRNAAWRLRASLRALADAADLGAATAAKATAEADLQEVAAASNAKYRFKEPPNKRPSFRWTPDAAQCLVDTAVELHQDWHAIAATMSQKLSVDLTYMQCYNKYRSLSPSAAALAPAPPAAVAVASRAAPPPPPPPPLPPVQPAGRSKRLLVAKKDVERATNSFDAAAKYATAKAEADSELEIAQRAAHEAAELAWLSSVLKVIQVPKQSEQTLLSIVEQQLQVVIRRLAKKENELSTAQERWKEFHEVPMKLKNGETKPRSCWLRRCYPVVNDSTTLPSVRDQALRSLKLNFFSNIAKQKVDGRSFHLQFKSKKERQTSFEISNEHWNCEAGFWSALRDPKQCTAERHRRPDLRTGLVVKTRELPSTVNHTVRLLQTRFGQLYVVLRFHVTGATEKQGAYRVAACDPGLRRFLSVLDVNNNRLVKLGDGAIRRIYGLLQRRDRLALCCRTDLAQCAPSLFKALQMTGPMNHRRRHHMRRRLARLDQRISNVVDGMQRDIAKWLCMNFDLILLPRFGTSEMIRRTNRTIGKRTARGLQMLAFHRFEQRLTAMAARHGCTVKICSEAWSTKSCPICRHINMDLGSSLVFCCENCAFTSDREFVGSVNILARFVADQRQAQQRQAQQPQAQASTAQAQAATTTTTTRPDSFAVLVGTPTCGQGAV